MQYVALAAAAVKVVGALAQGKQQEAQFNAYAKGNEYNAAVLRQRSDSVLAGANMREEQQRRVARLHAGETRAGAAQSGTGLGGSNADVERQGEVFSELDALNIRYEGKLESTNVLNQAGMEDWQAGWNREQGKVARKMSYIGAAGAALGGAADVYTAGKYGSTTVRPTTQANDWQRM